MIRQMKKRTSKQSSLKNVFDHQFTGNLLIEILCTSFFIAKLVHSLLRMTLNRTCLR